ncbi:2-hydroxycarboxylate transporter family protein [Acidaminococcus massiliensis]|uniref:2-hydroxycarboxylate transporter family protein n=1 Tax=Acidaminococcus massiliensis TaxID=1852375 RepID=UPI00248E3A16|nr:2-hydroxycarboxylate transporter family protein [Acidaminococcus massiliensis]
MMRISFDEKSKWNVMNVPMAVYLLFSAVVFFAMYTNRIPKSLYGGIAVCMVFGYGLKFIIEHVVILKKTIGLAACSLMTALFVYWHWIPEATVKIVKGTINGNTDLLGFFVGALLCGSIMGMDRKMLIKAGSRYFVPIFGGILFSYGVTALVGELLGFSARETILLIVGPIMGGGNGAGAVPMSEIYSAATGKPAGEIYSQIIPAVTMGNWMAVLGAVVLNMLGEAKPGLTGNGALMQGSTVESSSTHYPFQFAMQDLGVGMAMTAAFMIFGRIISKFFPSMHAYAFTIIAVAAVKIAGILPEKVEYCVVQWYQFIRTNFLVVIMAGVGIAMFNISSMLQVLTWQYLVLVITVVVMAVIGAGLFGLLVKFYFVESAITAGLCMANAGGNGDVYVLTACNRMELMPFAQISSRLGGALILIIQSFMISWLL